MSFRCFAHSLLHKTSVAFALNRSTIVNVVYSFDNKNDRWHLFEKEQ